MRASPNPRAAASKQASMQSFRTSATASAAVAAAAQAAPPNPDDPWASLQSAYAIADDGHARVSPGRASPARRDLAAGAGSMHQRHHRGAHYHHGQAAGDGIVELDDDGSEVAAARTSGAAAAAGVAGGRSSAGRPLVQHVSATPKQGQWGSGALARAGTLMVGDGSGQGSAGAVAAAGGGAPAVDPKELEALQQRVQQRQAAGVR